MNPLTIKWRWLPAIVGVILGVAAFIPDITPEPISHVLVPVVSSGFGWGAVALVTALFACSLKSAVTAGIGTLVLATVTYYCLILFVSQRWHQNATMTLNGHAASLAGLMSVLRSLAFWLCGSICGGSLMGWLAHQLRHGSIRRGTVGLGVIFGLLGGQGLYTFFNMTFIWVGPIDSFAWHQMRTASVQLLLATATLVVAIRLRNRPVNWAILAATAMVSVVVSATLWYVIQSVTLTM